MSISYPLHFPFPPYSPANKTPTNDWKANPNAIFMASIHWHTSPFLTPLAVTLSPWLAWTSYSLLADWTSSFPTPKPPTPSHSHSYPLPYPTTPPNSSDLLVFIGPYLDTICRSPHASLPLLVFNEARGSLTNQPPHYTFIPSTTSLYINHKKGKGISITQSWFAT